MTVNKVILIGNLGADPETRTTPGGVVVSNLRIATTERRKDRDGNWTDHTEWHKVVCFGRTAENVSKFLKKGRQLYVEGALRTQKWQDKEGKDRWTTEVVANEIRFLGGGERGQGGGGGGHGGERGGSSGGGGGGYSGGGEGHGESEREPWQEGSGGGGSDDDIPF
jgi:single-strand DNA-binding protein